MKIAVISDIHGNYDALVAVLEKAKTEGVEHLLVLGDTFIIRTFILGEAIRSVTHVKFDNAFIEVLVDSCITAN